MRLLRGWITVYEYPYRIVMSESCVAIDPAIEHDSKLRAYSHAFFQNHHKCLTHFLSERKQEHVNRRRFHIRG